MSRNPRPSIEHARIHAVLLLLGSLAILVAACTPSAHAAGSRPPSGVAEQRLREWLEVFNGKVDGGPNDYPQVSAALERFAQERLAAQVGPVERERWTGGWLGARHDGGRVVVVSMSAPTKTTANAILRATASEDQYWLVTVEVQPEAPHAITLLKVQPTERPSSVARIPRLSEAQAIKVIRRELAGRAAKEEFSGAVQIASEGRVLFQGAYGFADRERSVQNSVETRFRIASMNKMFTGTAIVQLAQAGRLSLQDSVGKYLPDYPNKELASKVTVHQLLTHTGGTGDFFGEPAYSTNRDAFKELRDYTNALGTRGVRFEPGTQWEYSNYGYIILGRVIEAVSGESYYDYVREHIYQPAGMARTDSLAETEDVQARATGYSGPIGARERNDSTLPYRGSSAGGGYSTVGDLTRFAQALTEHRLLNRDFTDLLTTGKVNTGGERLLKYAYGFEDVCKDGVRHVGHYGGAPGMNGALMIVTTPPHYVIAVLANVDPPAAERVAKFIRARLPAQESQCPNQSP